MPAITKISYQRNKQHFGGCSLGMKTQEELNALKEDVETVSRKLYELNDDELTVVSGGHDINYELIRQLLEIIFAPVKENEK